jgi:AraC-like DNA-binding protein
MDSTILFSVQKCQTGSGGSGASLLERGLTAFKSPYQLSSEAVPMDSRIQMAISTIQNRFSREIVIDQLARKANISASHLRHLFKLETGLTLTQYIKLIRMQKAEQLLLTTFLSVKEIMNRVGIKNESYFSREFKRAFGLAPLQYRNSVERPGKKQPR